MQRKAEVARRLELHAEAEAAREAETGRRRIRVVPVNSEGNPLLSLGMLMTNAEAYRDGALNEHYQFLPDWADQTVPKLGPDDPPGVFLFSNYIWSHAWNVVRSAEVKERNPESLTVHGGPNTPKYDDDIQAFFAMNPQVDITVHGEGEATLAHLLDVLKESLAAGKADRSLLADVPGLSYRDGDRVVHTGPRDRIQDLDSIPSPYESGLFDSVGDVEITLMTIETNRGCPYGCTYCDWGSATLSRIRRFDLERVYRELEWCARHKVSVIFSADANFGIFAHDVDIARRIVELKQQYGYPKVFESSYAKNTVKHLREIIEILAAGDVLSTGTLSLQSVDPATLDAIRRSNIKVEKYDDLAVEFAKQDLPLVIELMMGLPGSTLESFLGDLQQCIDREVKARVNPTEVLMNSPMNDPEYRREHQIATLRPVNQDWSEDNRTRKKALVVSTSSFSRDDYDAMERYRVAFVLCENFALLRQVSRFVRQETGVREMDFYVQLVEEARADPNRWPAIAYVFDVVVELMIPPASWRLFIDEVRTFCITAPRRDRPAGAGHGPPGPARADPRPRPVVPRAGRPRARLRRLARSRVGGQARGVVDRLDLGRAAAGGVRPGAVRRRRPPGGLGAGPGHVAALRRRQRLGARVARGAAHALPPHGQHLIARFTPPATPATRSPATIGPRGVRRRSASRSGRPSTSSSGPAARGLLQLGDRG